MRRVQETKLKTSNFGAVFLFQHRVSSFAHGILLHVCRKR